MASRPDVAPSPLTARLLLSCLDQKGLVARVADFVWKLGGDIVHADQHTDDQAGIFFQRVEFLMEGLSVDRLDLRERFARLATELHMNWRLSFSDESSRVAIMVSRQGHCLYDLLARWSAGELSCEMVAVISNWPDHADAAGHFGLPYFELPVGPDGGEDQEAVVLDVLTAHRVDLLVLARYMRVPSPRIIEPYRNRVINIHHSFLPASPEGGRMPRPALEG